MKRLNALLGLVSTEKRGFILHGYDASRQRPGTEPCKRRVRIVAGRCDTQINGVRMAHFWPPTHTGCTQNSKLCSLNVLPQGPKSPFSQLAQSVVPGVEEQGERVVAGALQEAANTPKLGNQRRSVPNAVSDARDAEREWHAPCLHGGHSSEREAGITQVITWSKYRCVKCFAEQVQDAMMTPTGGPEGRGPTQPPDYFIL